MILQGNHEKSWKITLQAAREIFPSKLFFEILFMIILMHNLAENRETETGNRYVASDLVMKSLTDGSTFNVPDRGTKRLPNRTAELRANRGAD